MSHRLVDIEVTEPLQDISLSAEETGLAVLLRCRQTPIDFWLEAMPAERTLTGGELERRIAERASVKLLSESIRDELVPPLEASPLPALTIAICTRGRPESVRRCLASILALDINSASSTRVPEVLVVEHAPSDRQTEELLTSMPQARYVREVRRGLVFARNRALGQAKGELIAYLDDAMIVDRRWAEGLRRAWVRNPDAAGYTGLVLPAELATRAQLLLERRGGVRAGIDRPFQRTRHGRARSGCAHYPYDTRVFGTGANMAFRREVLQQLGGFDESLDAGRDLPSGEDLDVFYRAILAGHSLAYEPEYLAFHTGAVEDAELRHWLWNSGRSVMAFVARSCQTEPGRRPQLRRFALSWFRKQLSSLWKSLTRREPLAAAFVTLELLGGIVGLAGQYSRSWRKAAQTRRQFA